MTEQLLVRQTTDELRAVDERCDNQLVVYAAQRQRPRAEALIVFAQERAPFARRYEAEVAYVHTKENTIADTLSRTATTWDDTGPEILQNRRVGKNSEEHINSLFFTDPECIQTKTAIFGSRAAAPKPQRILMTPEMMWELAGGLRQYTAQPPTQTPPTSDDEEDSERAVSTAGLEERTQQESPHREPPTDLIPTEEAMAVINSPPKLQDTDEGTLEGALEGPGKGLESSMSPSQSAPQLEDAGGQRDADIHSHPESPEPSSIPRQEGDGNDEPRKEMEVCLLEPEEEEGGMSPTMDFFLGDRVQLPDTFGQGIQVEGPHNEATILTQPLTTDRGSQPQDESSVRDEDPTEKEDELETLGKFLRGMQREAGSGEGTGQREREA